MATLHSHRRENLKSHKSGSYYKGAMLGRKRGLAKEGNERWKVKGVKKERKVEAKKNVKKGSGKCRSVQGPHVVPMLGGRGLPQHPPVHCRL
jgi:hypothetical protein